MIKNIVHKFEAKHPEFEFNMFLEYFDNGYTREQLCNEFNITSSPMRAFVYSLGLDFVKSKRKQTLDNLKYRISKENGDRFELIEELQSDIDTVLNKNRKLMRSINTVRDENNQLKKLVKIQDKNSNAYEDMLDIFERSLNDLTKLTQKQRQPKFKHKKHSNLQEDGLMLILGDEHFGSQENDEEVGNNFNYDVAERRLQYMVEKTLTNPNQSKNLTVVELLDITQGLLHDMEYLSEDGITTAMYKVVEVYTKLYEQLAPNYNKITVYVTNSNHDRTTKMPSSYMKYDNFGIFLMRMVDMVLKSKGINIEFSFTKKEYQMFNINSADVVVFHGDSIRSYASHSETARAHLQSICLGTFKKPYKHAISGHTHKANASMNAYGGFNITNGTLVGTGLYGVANGFSNINPSQSILFINELGDFEDIKMLNLNHIQ